MQTRVRWPVFLPAAASLAIAVALALLIPDSFQTFMDRANAWVLATFGTAFSWAAFLFVFICLAAYVSPLGRVRIGGESAQPIFGKARWFAVTICTTVAIGLLFWACAEPVYHWTSPPKSLNLVPKSSEAMQFAKTTLFFHWGFTPYAIYAVGSLSFALAFYNRKRPWSLTSMFSMSSRESSHLLSSVVDSLCLFTLVAGMAASLGTGLLTLAGGITSLFAWDASTVMGLSSIAILVTATFVVSSVSGVKRGVVVLSAINIVTFAVIALMVFVAGPTMFIVQSFLETLVVYIREFVPFSLQTQFTADDPWPTSWSVFYWANWLAWAPVTAMFLGRLGVGYTVREFIRMNLLWPGLFSLGWVALFSNATLWLQISGTHDLASMLATGGPESLVYVVLGGLPGGSLVIGLFLFSAFLSYVTAADSNTLTMASLSIKGSSESVLEPPQWLKIFWGGLIGSLAVIMVCFSGIDGIKTLSNLGGLPSLVLMLFAAANVIWMTVRPKFVS
jgi:glycine betaine transporter